MLVNVKLFLLHPANLKAPQLQNIHANSMNGLQMRTAGPLVNMLCSLVVRKIVYCHLKKQRKKNSYSYIGYVVYICTTSLCRLGARHASLTHLMF